MSVSPAAARPAIFISAVTDELKAAKERVARVIEFLRFQAEQMDITPDADCTSPLEKKIGGCAALIQLVGMRYGPETQSDEATGERRSYANHEARFAGKQGLKVWHLMLDESYPFDAAEPEDGKRQTLQRAYRIQIESSPGLCNGIRDEKDLEI